MFIELCALTLQEWRDAGVFERFLQNGLLPCEHLDGIDWSWLSDE